MKNWTVTTTGGAIVRSRIRILPLRDVRPVLGLLLLTTAVVLGMRACAGPETAGRGASAVQLAYVERFAKVAQGEYAKFGIPASISLAQGLLESEAGTSTLARKANNHFGIKCFAKRCGSGHCMNLTDDSHKDFFRKYATAWDSWRAHSQLLMKPNYKRCRDCGDDVECWARELKRAGYATDKRYREKLLAKIQSLDLQRFDP